MRETVLVIGGVRSGKSLFAVELAGELAGDLPAYFIATARRDRADPAMLERIERHRVTRPRKRWKTIEEPLDIGAAVLEIEGNPKIRRRPAPPEALILVDCLTVWLSNMLALAGDPDSPGFTPRAREVYRAGWYSLATAMGRSRSHLIFVTNEVGMGVAPPTRLGNVFADLQGDLNHSLAIACSRVYSLTAGVPVRIT